MTREITFSKLSGAGNDFIVIDDREGTAALSAETIRRLCRRRTGIGADGLILIARADGYDFSMRYHNADGLPGTMCGNGGRCAVWFAHALGIRGNREGCYRFEASGDTYQAWVTGPETVRLRMREPKEFRSDIELDGASCHFVDTGSPHAILLTSSVDAIDVPTEGRRIRNRTDLFAGGTNVNFIEAISPTAIALRTFERGVEDETLACGTGAVASALWSHKLGLTSGNRVAVTVRSGDRLEVDFSDDLREVYLTGPATVVYRGSFTLA